MKRLIDFVLALILILICLPFYPIFWLLYANQQGAVLTKDRRVGKDNKIITLYRYRQKKTKLEDQELELS